ncbi:MAG: hypothetical protein LBF28_02145 [Rickettsiales bacterium]|nr:hypothetical protein [Rickettsiales bacterium]
MAEKSKLWLMKLASLFLMMFFYVRDLAATCEKNCSYGCCPEETNVACDVTGGDCKSSSMVNVYGTTCYHYDGSAEYSDSAGTYRYSGTCILSCDENYITGTRVECNSYAPISRIYGCGACRSSQGSGNCYTTYEE